MMRRDFVAVHDGKRWAVYDTVQKVWYYSKSKSADYYVKWAESLNQGV